MSFHVLPLSRVVAIVLLRALFRQNASVRMLLMPTAAIILLMPINIITFGVSHSAPLWSPAPSVAQYERRVGVQ